MDEEKEKDETGGQPEKANPFNSISLYVSYLVTGGFLCGIPLLLARGSSSDWTFSMLIICIPCVVIGIIAWLNVRKTKRAAALGILFGCLTPFVIVFILTGGCGLTPNFRLY